MSIDVRNAYRARIQTDIGNLEVQLFADRAPKTVNNFVFLARDGFYDDVIFHRIISGFMIQGGDPTGTGRGGPGYRFRDETEGAGDYSRGTVAMANAGPNTNGSQFFICHGDAPLPHSYTIFGKVTSGLDTVDAIAALETDRSDRPKTDATMKSVTISES